VNNTQIEEMRQRAGGDLAQG